MPLLCFLCTQAALLAPVAIWIHKSPWISHLAASDGSTLRLVPLILERLHWGVADTVQSLPCSLPRSFHTIAQGLAFPFLLCRCGTGICVSRALTSSLGSVWGSCQAVLHAPFLESAHWATLSGTDPFCTRALSSVVGFLFICFTL